MDLFSILVGVTGVTCAVLQGFAAAGRLRLDFWPFAQSSQGMRWFFAVAWLFIGVAALVIGLRS